LNTLWKTIWHDTDKDYSDNALGTASESNRKLCQITFELGSASLAGDHGGSLSVLIHGQQRQQQHTFWVAQINIPVVAVNINANSNPADVLQWTWCLWVALQNNRHAFRIYYTEHESKETFLTPQAHPGKSSSSLSIMAKWREEWLSSCTIHLLC
jgi:hypothetical protein